MKKLLTLLSISTSFVILSCSDDGTSPGKPVEWITYVSFEKAATQEDFFQSNESYHYEQVRFGNEKILRFGSTVVRKLNGKHLYELNGWGDGQEVYAYFGNGDIDTLQIDFIPSTLSGAAIGMDTGVIEWIKFYYNSELVEDWNFIENPELRREIIRRDMITSDISEPADPVIIYLAKDPDPEEFD